VTVLIVDDCELMRRLIKTLICCVADVIVECASGEAACEAYAAHRPDWVLMDIQLPGLDGVAATGQIRAAFPDARIVIVSDYGDERLRAAARAAGACGYVLKENLLEVRRRLEASCKPSNQ
jgi:DNA-binding NarL/FixJ family response regulator